MLSKEEIKKDYQLKKTILSKLGDSFNMELMDIENEQKKLMAEIEEIKKRN